MSVIQCSDTFNGQELQIWNNSAFDNGESQDSTAIKGSWSNLQSVYVNKSHESACSKENLSPRLIKSPVSCVTSSVPVKPAQMNSPIKNSQMKPMKSVSMQGHLDKFVIGSTNGVEEEEVKRDERKIDMEIEEVEKEISRLSSRLEALRLEKIDIKTKAIEKRGRFVPAKFMEQKQSFKNVENMMKKSDENLLSSDKSKLNRRGVSLGPAEIFSAAKSRPSFGKPEIITPVQSIQSRRKSCFWKLQEIDELHVTKERGKSLSTSPKSRKTVTSKIPPKKQAVTTVGSRKVMKKEDAVLSLIQPRKLFKDGEKSVSKKPLKPGRMVASRYNQTTNDACKRSLPDRDDARKRSLPDIDKDESNTCYKRRTSRESGVTLGRSQKTQTRVKKRWEIPTEVVVYKGSPPSVSQMGNVLPKIRTVQCVGQSPRDSGAAKRVSELVGGKSFFCAADEEKEAEEGFACQALTFDGSDFEEE